MTVAPVRFYLLKGVQALHTSLNARDLDTAVAMISPSAEIRTPMESFTGGSDFWRFEGELRQLGLTPGQVSSSERAAALPNDSGSKHRERS